MRAAYLHLVSLLYASYFGIVNILDEKSAHIFSRAYLGLVLAPLASIRRGNLEKFFGERYADSNRLRQLDRESRRYLVSILCENARGGGRLESFLDRNGLSGEEHLRDALSQGRGVMILGAHLGGFLHAYGGLSLRGYAVTNVSVKIPVASIERHQNLLRRRFKVNSVFVGKNAALAAAKIFRTGGIFCIMIDLARRPEHIVWLPFGQTFIGLDDGPARLAVRFNVPVLPLTAYLQRPGHSQLVIGAPLPLPTGADEEERIRNTLVQWKNWLEGEVSAHPEQWWCWSFIDLGMPVAAK